MTMRLPFAASNQCTLGVLLFCSVAWADGEPVEKSPHSAFTGTKAGQVREDNEPKIKLVWCPPGNFTMGSPEDEKYRRYSEGQVQVTLTKGFWLGKYELTQAQWQRVMKTKPWSGKAYVKEGDDYPATFVNWFEATDFCRKLSDDEHHAGRLPTDWTYALPTEAEWEYACRAGTTTRYSFGDDESYLPEYGWFGGINFDAGHIGNARKEQYAHAVGKLKPNGWGLYDMHGNVWELCQDVYAGLPGGNNPLVSIKDVDLQVFRGGSWKINGRYCRSAFRNGTEPSGASDCLGFRIAAVATVK